MVVGRLFALVFPWGPMGAYGGPWGPMVVGRLFDLVFPWGPMGAYVFPWGPMVVGWLFDRMVPWGPMGTYGVPWGPMVVGRLFDRYRLCNHQCASILFGVDAGIFVYMELLIHGFSSLYLISTALMQGL